MKYLLSRISYANAGLKYFFSNERNGRTQGIIAICILLLGLVCGISRIEWAVILVCMAAVLALEMMNTALEMVCNFLTKDFDLRIKHIKDIAAAAVWLASLVSVIVGLLIFLPYLTAFFHNASHQG